MRQPDQALLYPPHDMFPRLSTSHLTRYTPILSANTFSHVRVHCRSSLLLVSHEISKLKPFLHRNPAFADYSTCGQAERIPEQIKRNTCKGQP